MTEAEMDAIIRTDAGGEVTYRDRRIFLAAVEWAASRLSAAVDTVDGEHFADILRDEVAQLG